MNTENFKWPMIGHKNIKKYLQEAIKRNKLVHAYLFVGPNGVGKTVMVNYFIQSIWFIASVWSIISIVSYKINKISYSSVLGTILDLFCYEEHFEPNSSLQFTYGFYELGCNLFVELGEFDIL